MNILIVSIYAAICIALFALLRIPLNRWTVPGASIGGIALIFTLVQLLNFYHPYSDTSRQYSGAARLAPDEPEADTPAAGTDRILVAYFHQNSLLRLNDGSAVEVTFDSIPGQVFSGRLRMESSLADQEQASIDGNSVNFPISASQSGIPVLIEISDPRYQNYVTRIRAGSHAAAAVYSEELYQLAVVRKTLLRMSAWMNYLTPLS